MKRFLIISVILLLGAGVANADLFDMPGDADLWMNGGQDSGHFGYSVVMGDFNGDGFDDMAVGEPYHDETGLAAPTSDVGRVWVFWGNDDDAPDLLIRLVDAPNSPYWNWRLGYDLAVGDVNGDGIDDLLTAAPGAYQPASMMDAGAVFVFYGRTAWASNQIILDPNGAAGPAVLADVQVFGEGYGYFGSKITSGDLNDDGFDDIVGSEPRFPPGGRVFVVYGADDDSQPVYTLIADADLEIRGPDYMAQISMGNGLASGDVNGDGIDDLLMGAPGNVYVGDKASFNGSVHILYGRTGWTEAAPIDLDVTPEDILISGVNDQSNLGWAIAVGDVNGDGYGDIVMGASELPYPVNKGGSDGAVYVVYGEDFAPNTDIDLDVASNRDITIHGQDGEYLHFGFSVATGDINGDCIDDILAGEFYTDNAFLSAFAVYGSDQFSANEVLQMPGDAAHRLTAAQDMDLFGYAVALGDADGDMLDDMFVSAKNFDIPTGDYVGATYLVYSPESNLPPIADAGEDQSGITGGETVTLDGSGSSDPEGFPITYSWMQLDGPVDVTLSDANAVSPTFAPDVCGTYTFELIVSECLQDSAPDEVDVEVDTDCDDPPVGDDDDADDPDDEEEEPGFFGTGGCGAL
jgi:K319L-like, PKD domain/FG-GAP repeat